MTRAEWHQLISGWKLPADGALMDRIERMVRPALLAGYFGASYTGYVAGWQYHPGGQTDTADLAKLAEITANDHVLDVDCFIGGAAIQLAETWKCRVMGVDMAPNCIAAANRIAELAGLAHLVTFRVADAGNLPFEDETFSVVWNQGALEHRGAWLEFDRVLTRGGRMAMTFEVAGSDPRAHGQYWKLVEVVRFLQQLGYFVEHAEALDTARRWQALDAQLSAHEQEFAWLLGADWVREAHAEFARVIAETQTGQWGIGRIVAKKSGSPREEQTR